MVYTVEFTKAAAKELKKLERPIQILLVEALEALADNPRPDGVKKLSGSDDLWRIRVGDYRSIYTIQDEIVLVTVVRVRHRREAY